MQEEEKFLFDEHVDEFVYTLAMALRRILGITVGDEDTLSADANSLLKEVMGNGVTSS